MANLATAISDGAVALSALAGGVHVLRARQSQGRGQALAAAAAGLILIGVTAAVGTVRHATGIPFFETAHVALNDVARYAAMPLIGAGFFAAHWRPLSARGWQGLVLALAVLPLVARAIGAGVANLYALGIGGLGVIAILATAARARTERPGPARASVIGGLLILLAGLVIGTKGEFFGFARVDLYHYALAVGLALLARGLVGLGSSVRGT